MADYMRQCAFRFLSILILERRFRLWKEVVLHEGVSHKDPAYDPSEAQQAPGRHGYTAGGMSAMRVPPHLES
jgi:hypothetical protein